MPAEASELVAWLDAYLRLDEIRDYPGALNGLQVEARRPIGCLGAATDACQATIDAAGEAGCDLLLVHHGLFWGDPSPLVGPAYRRIARLVRDGTGLYAAHLPLDVHPEVGNNALLAGALGFPVIGRFGPDHGTGGLGLLVEAGVGLEALRRGVADACGGPPYVIPGGPDEIRTLAVVTGGGGSLVAEAAAAGADAFLTGEGKHHTYHEAMELGITVLYAGHYATETFGVRELAARAAARFDLEWEFFDVPTGL